MNPAREKYTSIYESVKKATEGNHARLRRPNPFSGCPLTAALAAIGGKWKLIILYWLAESPKHFAALRRVIPGISQAVTFQNESTEVERNESFGKPVTPTSFFEAQLQLRHCRKGS